jgi:histidinol-phosphate aminotransferase
MINEFKAGLSRRSFMRTLGAASVAATSLPSFAAFQQTRAADAAMTGGGERTPRPADAVVLGGNENPLGPSAPALEAMAATGALGGRYNHQLTNDTVKAFSANFGLKPGYVNFFAGSSGPLDLALYLNIGPGKDLIVCEPAYEQGPNAATAMGAKVFRVPLTKTGAHDVKAMVAASTTPGAFYICNPNNPTGTTTPKQDIVWLVKNKPAGSVVIVDEAYHHFSNDESSIDLVAADQDVMVLRTFSKIYGMAGLRGGLFIAKPDLQAKLASISSTQKSTYLSGSWTVSIMTAAAATASINDKTLIPARRKINTDIRENVLAWMDKNGYVYYKGSQANFFMVDGKRPGREFSALMQQDHVYVGRTWAAMPTYVRVTVGTQQEMDRFKLAFKKAYETAPLPASALLELPFHEMPSELNRHLRI